MQVELFYFVISPLALICLLSFGYLLFSLIAIERFTYKQPAGDQEFQPPVTIFKPIRGLDPDMAENLRSFCQQDYPEYQVIFGLQDQDDPALDVITRIIREFAHRDISFIINPRRHGSNHKVSNLINMYPDAKHDYILIADSDMRVPGNYLTSVMSPFASGRVGAVTCVYSGSARHGIASALNAMFINGWFLPSVLISEMIEKTRYCLGATMVLRREILEEIGGFEALKDHLADDYMLGKMVSDAGYEIHLSHFMVNNIVHEPSFKSLFLHELRWGRTLKTVEPVRYAITFLTDTFILSCLTGLMAILFTDQLLWPIAIICLALIMRILLHSRVKSILKLDNAGSVWLIPVRDLLNFIIRVVSFTGSSIHWRDHDFSVDSNGLIHEKEDMKALAVKNEKIIDLATSQDY